MTYLLIVATRESKIAIKKTFPRYLREVKCDPISLNYKYFKNIIK
jgi:hypothetical protein